jgi:hypothetical protein
VFSIDFMVTTLAIATSQIAGGVLSDLIDPRVLAAGFGGITVAYGCIWWIGTRPARAAAYPRRSPDGTRQKGE